MMYLERVLSRYGSIVLQCATYNNTDVVDCKIMMYTKKIK